MIFTKVIKEIQIGFLYSILWYWKFGEFIGKKKKIPNFRVSKNQNWQKQIDLKQHLPLASPKKYSIGKNSPKIKTLVLNWVFSSVAWLLRKDLVINPIISFFENWSITYSPNIKCSNSISYPNDTFIIYVGYQS
jgi:hypothetical protein